MNQPPLTSKILAGAGFNTGLQRAQRTQAWPSPDPDPDPDPKPTGVQSQPLPRRWALPPVSPISGEPTDSPCRPRLGSRGAAVLT